MVVGQRNAAVSFANMIETSPLVAAYPLCIELLLLNEEVKTQRSVVHDRDTKQFPVLEFSNDLECHHRFAKKLQELVVGHAYCNKLGQVAEHVLQGERLLRENTSASWREGSRMLRKVAQLDAEQLLGAQQLVTIDHKRLLDSMQVSLSLVGHFTEL